MQMLLLPIQQMSLMPFSYRGLLIWIMPLLLFSSLFKTGLETEKTGAHNPEKPDPFYVLGKWKYL